MKTTYINKRATTDNLYIQVKNRCKWLNSLAGRVGEMENLAQRCRTSVTPTTAGFRATNISISIWRRLLRYSEVGLPRHQSKSGVVEPRAPLQSGGQLVGAATG